MKIISNKITRNKTLTITAITIITFALILTISTTTAASDSTGADIPLEWNGPTVENTREPVSTETELQNAVEDGTTGEVIYIDSDITLNSTIDVNDANETIVSATSPRQTIENAENIGSIFDINADGVTIRGLRINNSKEYGDKGIRLQGSRSDVAIENNVITNCWEPIIFNSTTTSHENITIANNELSGSYIGIMAFTVNNSTIRNNYIHDIGNWGIQMTAYGGAPNVPKNNTIRKNTIENIYVAGAGDIYLQAKNTLIERNKITGSSYVGVLLTDAIARYSTGDLDVSGTEIHYNNIIGHSGKGVWTIENFQSDLSAGTSIDATYNWWGDSSGPSGVGPGEGDAVTENVSFDPWLDASYPDGSAIGFDNSKTEDSVESSDSVNAENEADTTVDFDNVDTGVSGSVTVGKLDNNPGSSSPSGNPVKYIGISTSISNDNINSVDITISYTDSEISGIAEDSLTIYYWNGDSWESLSTTVDSNNNTATATVTHLSSFALAGSSSASFEISDLSIDQTSVSPGESVDISASVTNTGDWEGTYTARLEIDGEEVGQDSVTLDSGDSGTVSFQVSRTSSRTYDVNLEGLQGSFNVLSPASFMVSDLEVSPELVGPGGTVTITCTVTNTGEISDSYNVVLKNGAGMDIDSKAVLLNGGESQEVEFTMSNLSQGKTYTVMIGNEEGTFRVQSVGGEPVEPEEEPTDSTIPIILLGITAVIAAVLVAIVAYQET